MNTMTLPELEGFYDYLAETLDKVGSENTSIFLTKLVLLLAWRGQQKHDQLLAIIDEAVVDL